MHCAESAWSCQTRLAYVQQPLRQRDGHQPRPPEAVLHRRLEGVGAAELRVDDNETDGPVNDDGEANEQRGARDEAGVADCVRLANDASASAALSALLARRRRTAHMMLFAMFIKALRMPLRGRALSRWSSGSNASSATVTLGASTPVSRGSRCTVSRPFPSCM
jgi:hypothetical protein